MSLSTRKADLLETLDMRRDLIEACKRNDRIAQKTLYLSYSDAMYNVAYRILKNEEDARDIIQVSFVDIFKNLSRFKYESTPGAWIKRIVINKSLSLLKQNKRLQFQELGPHTIDVAEKIDTREDFDLDIVKKAIESLPNGYRTVLTLYLIEGYDHNEISEILNISNATSKSQYSRAKQKLRKRLSK